MFRPRKQDVEQLQQRDFLGKAKVDDSHGECCVMGLCNMVGLLQHPSFYNYQNSSQFRLEVTSLSHALLSAICGSRVLIPVSSQSQ